MIDLHTHILPEMDDGARSIEESISMLRLQREQGVSTVVLTPHFYRNREQPESFFQRRKVCMERLMEALPEGERLPDLLLGAEVSWMPNLCDWEELPQLCIGNTNNMLLELPVTPWTDRLVNQLYDLMGRTGITPILAHLERYLRTQRREMVEAVLSLELPVQLSSEALLHTMTRGSVLRLLKNGQAHLLASDCHGCETRSPTLGAAMEVVRKKLGEYVAEELCICARELAGG